MKKKQMTFRVMGWITALFILCLPVLGRAESPVIENVELFNFRDLTTPVTEFVIGDRVTFTVYGRDADLDCRYLYITQYFLGYSDSEPYLEDLIDMGTQETEIDSYTPDPNEEWYSIGPAGEWRADFQVEDMEGNLSNIFVIYTTAYKDQLPDPIDDDDSGGGGGGGGGGCYISISGGR